MKYVESLGEIVKSNDKSSDHLYQLFNDTREGLQNYLNENVDKLTPEERKGVSEQIFELVRIGVQLDKDNKAFLLRIANVVGGVVGLVGMAIIQVI